MSETKETKAGNEAVLQEARRRFKEARDADQHNRSDALDDLKFSWNLDNYQWPQYAKELREGRPMLVENRLPQFLRMIVNAQRQNRPSITVKPVDSKGDPAVAQVVEGIIRHIEQYSKADLAYDSAFESAVTCGIGYFRVATEYCDDTSFDQDILIRPIENPFSVYDDPRYSMPDASDRRYCFVTEVVSREDFEAEYGFEPVDLDELGTGDDWIEDWFEGDDKVRVAEYWRVRTETKSVYMTPLGMSETKPQTVAGEPDPQSRQIEKRIVEQYVLTGDRIIKKSDWAGSLIPIIPVMGECRTIDGRKHRKSLIRDAKDAQRTNNYWLSVETEMVALQPRAPFIGPVGAFETDAAKWATANTDNHAYIQFDGPAMPQRQPPPVFPSAVRETRMAAIESIKSILGIYDASLGARSNETSGIAIEARQSQGDQATYHFIDNMTRAIRYAGTVVLDLLPKVYDAPRVTRILSPEGDAAKVAVNTAFVDPSSGQAGMIDLTIGKYDLVVKAGPNFATQRQEAAKMLSELIRAYPPLAQLAGDILFKNLDFPDADKIAERLRPAGDQQGLPPQVQKMIQDMQQALQTGKKAYEDLQHQLRVMQLQGLAKDLALKDKSGELAAKASAAESTDYKWIAEYLLDLYKVTGDQAAAAVGTMQQVEPAVEMMAHQ